MPTLHPAKAHADYPEYLRISDEAQVEQVPFFAQQLAAAPEGPGRCVAGMWSRVGYYRCPHPVSANDRCQHHRGRIAAEETL